MSKSQSLVLLALTIKYTMYMETKPSSFTSNYSSNSQLLNSLAEDQKTFDYLSKMEWFENKVHTIIYSKDKKKIAGLIMIPNSAENFYLFLKS